MLEEDLRTYILIHKYEIVSESLERPGILCVKSSEKTPLTMAYLLIFPQQFY